MGMIKPNMGIKDAPSMSHSLSDALFSGTKQRVLGILYGQPARSFYANELIGLRSPRKELLGHLLACCTSV